MGRCVLSISHFPRKLVEGAGTSQNKATLPNLEICKRNKDYFFALSGCDGELKAVCICQAWTSMRIFLSLERRKD